MASSRQKISGRPPSPLPRGACSRQGRRREPGDFAANGPEDTGPPPAPGRGDQPAARHMRPSPRRPGRAWRAGIAFALAALASAACLAQATQADDETLEARDRRLIAEAVAAMPAQRPGRPDLYVLGFAGDGHEDVFRNEVLYLERLMHERFELDGRGLFLVNHPDSLEEDAPRPLATLDNLRLALAGIGAAMDPDEDLLLLFVTTHGTEDHRLAVQLAPFVDEAIAPEALAGALADAGVRHRVLVISACYSGGFLPALRDPEALVITASRHDRTSFGCGSESHVTYFGQAWLVDALNRRTSFVTAFHDADWDITVREREAGFRASLPQIDQGERIGAVLRDWQSQLRPGPEVPYPYAAPAQAPAKADAAGRAPGKTPRTRSREDAADAPRAPRAPRLIRNGRTPARERKGQGCAAWAPWPSPVHGRGESALLGGPGQARRRSPP